MEVLGVSHKVSLSSFKGPLKVPSNLNHSMISLILGAKVSGAGTAWAALMSEEICMCLHGALALGCWSCNSSKLLSKLVVR